MDTKKQQVVFIADTLWAGEVEKVLHEIVHGLDQDRFTPVIVYWQESENHIIYGLKIVTIHIEPGEDDFNTIKDFLTLTYKYSGSALSHGSQHTYSLDDGVAEILPFALALRKALTQFSEDAILVPMDERNTVILWLSQIPPHRKMLASQHYPYSQAQIIRYPDERVRWIKEILYLNACRTADIVTFNSEEARLDLINNFGASPQRTIFMPNPINSKLVIQKSQQPLPDNVKLLHRKTVFTQVASLSDEKNPLLLVEACDLLRNKYNDFIVFYVGDGPLYNDVRQKIEEKKLQDHILLLGEQENPYPYMAYARAFLLTSPVESSSLVLAESIICGTVPIATDCNASSNELILDGNYGLLVPPNNPLLFSEAMYQIATDDLLYNRLRENALDWAMRFDSPRVIKEWEELIRKVAESQKDGE